MALTHIELHIRFPSLLARMYLMYMCLLSVGNAPQKHPLLLLTLDLMRELTNS